MAVPELLNIEQNALFSWRRYTNSPKPAESFFVANQIVVEVGADQTGGGGG